MTLPRLLRATALAVVAAVWIMTATLLWRATRVPDDLSLPHLDVRDYFTADELRRAERFERFLRIEFLLSQLALVGALAFWAWRGPRYVRESAAGRLGTGMLLGMLGLAVGWLSQLPFRLSEVWWERRYGILRTGYADALLNDWLALGGEFLAICLTLLIVMGLAGRFPRYWWLPATPFFVAVAALFIFTYPYLADTHRLQNRQLRADARAIAHEEGLGDVPVEVEKVSDETSAPNAEAAGFGPSRRVILWDTLLEFPDDEVRVVLAHEFGHLSRKHLPKALVWYTLFALPGAYLIAVATRRRGGMANPAAVPWSLLVVVVLGLVALPFENAISRHIEAEADWVALETTRDPGAAERLFRRFTRVALEQPDPPQWVALVTANHPTVEDRIAMVVAWRGRHRNRDGRDGTARFGKVYSPPVRRDS
jgi:Zn-dependent protease with chaperone function